MFSRPPRREKSALGTFPPVEPMLALQGREGQADFLEGRSRESASRVFTLDRHAERNPRLAPLSTATPREIRAWHLSPCRANVGSTGGRGPSTDPPPRRDKCREPMLALQGREGQPRISLDRAVERECQARISLDRHAERNPRFSLDRHAERNPRLLATLLPVEPMLPKIFKVQNRKKKKVSTMLPSFESSRREPHFYRIARIRSERDLILAFFYRKICICKLVWVPKDASLGDASFGPKGFIEVTKGQAWACILEFGTPPGSGIWTLLKLFPSPVRAQNFSPPALKLPPGYPSEALPERVRNRPFGRLWRTRVWCARRHIWREDSPSGELGGARVSLHKLSREPLHVSRNVEFSPLPSPPGVRTP